MDADELKYRRLRREVANTPIAMLPERWEAVREVIDFQARGGKLSREEILAHVDVEARGRERVQVTNGVAVVGVRGIISHRIEQVENISGPGGTSIEGLRNRLRAADADPAVGTIVLDIDSPGGSVDGVPELAREIRALNTRTIAVANTLAASAAYWLGSSADEFSVTESGNVGSIGVFAAHQDLSAMYERMGVKTTLISAGEHKTEGHPFGPLSRDARAFLQARIDETYSQFIDAVAAGRKTTRDDVLQNFGRGRVMGAQAALTAGMVDRVETLDQAISRARGSSNRPARRARAFEFM